MKAVAELASGLDMVRLRSEGVLDPDELEDIEDIAERVEERRGFPGDTFVLALAGGTGAGKSSLLNALAGEDVSSVSAVRPHTEHAVALVPPEASYELVAFLDDLAINDRVELDRFTEMAIIDLPDQDSLVSSHRELVWEVLPEVDAIAWVVDPDKYHDQTFLDDYVGGLAAYQDQAVFVLNKVDLLGEGDADEVTADLIGQLELRGIVEPTVFATAAAPPHQEPVGVAPLIDHFRDRLMAKRVLASKTIADIARAVSLITARARLDRGGAVGFEERWETVKAGIEESLGSNEPEDAMLAMDAFVASLVADVGPSFGRRLINAVPPHVIERELNPERRPDPAPVAKKQRFRRRRQPEETAAAPALEPASFEQALADPLRELLWDRSYLGATLAAVAVEAAQAQDKLTD